MNNYSLNDIESQLSEYETPFADKFLMEEKRHNGTSFSEAFVSDFESPFAPTYEAFNSGENQNSPAAGEFVDFISELYDDEFSENLYEMASELEDTWNGKISNEAAMGERFVPFATQEAEQYFIPVYNETVQMIDRVSEYFSGNNFADQSEAEVENYFDQLEFDHTGLSPAQEQFFGSILKKVKSVVKTGVNLAKKGIAAVGKILPIGPILNKLKALIRPLLDKVLKFAIGKLPKNLQPHAQTLAKKFLNLETEADTVTESTEIQATGDLQAVQSELDNYLANLVFSGNETESDNIVMEYESSSDNLERHNNYETSGLNVPSLDAARQQFINELKELQPGQSPAPAIEKFLPAAILALQPVIKIAISIIGRQKVINFLAGLLSKLVAKYVPEDVAKPLAAGIIDIGMSAIGFETYEMNRSDLAYEAIANTIQETIQNMGTIDEAVLNDQEMLMAETLEAFEKAAANNFPSKYIKYSKRLTSNPGTWVMMPRVGPKHLYKKYTRVFDVTLDNRIASTLTTFRGIPLINYLKDKLGIDLNNPVRARVHLYQGIPGTKLYMVSRFEKVPGISVKHGYRQLHPLSVQAASLLLNEPKLGRDFSPAYTTRRYQTAVGQRFYYLEIPGARLKSVSVQPDIYKRKPTITGPEVQNYVPVTPNSSDIQGVINFVKSEIRFNYYFSEEDAKSVAEKLNSKDYAGAFISIKHNIRRVLHGILLRNIGSKVKIVHESMPEMFLEMTSDNQEQFLGGIGKAIGGYALNAAKDAIKNIIEKLINKISNVAYNSVINYFKTRVNEFISEQSKPKDGVTLKIIWKNVPGMSAIGTIINAYKGKLSAANISGLSIPSLPAPEIKIAAGKHFD